MPYSQLKDVERADRKALNKGNTYVYYGDDDVVLHHLIENSQTLLVLGPAKMPTRPRAEALLRAFILAVLGLIILFWLAPISKDLDALRRSLVGPPLSLIGNSTCVGGFICLGAAFSGLPILTPIDVENLLLI